MLPPPLEIMIGKLVNGSYDSAHNLTAVCHLSAQNREGEGSSENKGAANWDFTGAKWHFALQDVTNVS